MTPDRRAFLTAAAAAAAMPGAVLSAQAASTLPAHTAASTIEALWLRVVDLSLRLGAHPTPIVHPTSGLPGWMYDQGEANTLGQARYRLLVDILRSQPQHANDRAIVAQAAAHPDIGNGPRTFGAARIGTAANTVAA